MANSMQDRTGQKRGKFTVIEDTGGIQLKCRCDCGHEELRPRAMFKPSYKGLLACARCLGSPCEVCGTIIPRKNRMPAKTCSAACADERHRRIERERYYLIKFTPEFLERQRRNRATHCQRMQNDPEYRERMRRAQRAALFMSRQRIKSDPQRYVAALEKNREQNGAWRSAINADPLKRLERLLKHKLYYRLVSKAKRK